MRPKTNENLTDPGLAADGLQMQRLGDTRVLAGGARADEMDCATAQDRRHTFGQRVIGLSLRAQFRAAPEEVDPDLAGGRRERGQGEAFVRPRGR